MVRVSLIFPHELDKVRKVANYVGIDVSQMLCSKKEFVDAMLTYYYLEYGLNKSQLDEIHALYNTIAHGLNHNSLHYKEVA